MRIASGGKGGVLVCAPARYKRNSDKVNDQTDDIYHIPIPNRAQSSAALLERYRSLKAIADELPLLENITYPDPPIADVLKQMNPNFFTPLGSTTITSEGPPNTPSETTAFAFALFGWSGLTESNIALATCNHCFQRNGLWLYKDERLRENSTKLDVPISSLRLDLLETHREHCPWKNPASQRNPKDGPIKNMTAWQTLEFLLLGNRTHRKRQENLSVTTVDASSYRDSTDVERPTTAGTEAESGKGKDGADSLNEKWRKFKAKLRRTTSRRSLKSVRSIKSGKSVPAGDKENNSSPRSTV